MDIIFGVVLGLFVLVFLVVVHELGHALVARRNGVVVEEFGIGFPPRAWGKKLKNGVLFSLNWLPLGGFVKLQGEHDSADGKGDYGSASFWQKTKILIAGVATNWIVAALIFSVLAVFGLPKMIDNQWYIPEDTQVTHKNVEIVSITDGLPAERAGFRTKDQLVRVAGEEISSTSDFIDTVGRLHGQEVVVEYIREGETKQAQVALRDTQSGGVFGAGLGQESTLRATWSAPILGVTTAAQLSWSIIEGLGHMLWNLGSGILLQFSGDEGLRTQAQVQLGEVSRGVAGPIGILGVLFPAAGSAGIMQVLLLSAVISLTLAIMNILPIPALDGGRWFTMAVFRLFKKPLTKDLEENIQASGFLALMVLVIVVTIADVAKLF